MSVWSLDVVPLESVAIKNSLRLLAWLSFGGTVGIQARPVGERIGRACMRVGNNFGCVVMV